MSLFNVVLSVPFALLLGCIAVFPLVPRLHHWWESNLFKGAVSLGLGFAAGVPMLALGHAHALEHALVEYAQFVLLLVTLFAVTGGIFLDGDLRAYPATNTCFLAIGGLIASFVGTTGAAMLLIRPVLSTNRERTHVAHTVVFLILIVANCGGLLTPLGDPPLFLGLLRGVPFTWTFSLWPKWLAVNVSLLLSYYVLDSWYYTHESGKNIRADYLERRPLRIVGMRNVALIAGIVLGVWQLPFPVRELWFLLLAAVSVFVGDQRGRLSNGFDWQPMVEVAVLFAGIFITMVPALMLVRECAPWLPVSAVSLFFGTGILSSMLDNAPTYATFFEVARSASNAGHGTLVAGVYEPYLRAVSVAAVFFGAMTYIGNGPNFMVRAIAEKNGVAMPQFFGYTLNWAFPFLGAILGFLSLTFTDSLVLQMLGWAGIFAIPLMTYANCFGRKALRPKLEFVPHA